MPITIQLHLKRELFVRRFARVGRYVSPGDVGIFTTLGQVRRGDYIFILSYRDWERNVGPLKVGETAELNIMTIRRFK